MVTLRELSAASASGGPARGTVTATVMGFCNRSPTVPMGQVVMLHDGTHVLHAVVGRAVSRDTYRRGDVVVADLGVFAGREQGRSWSTSTLPGGPTKVWISGRAGGVLELPAGADVQERDGFARDVDACLARVQDAVALTAHRAPPGTVPHVDLTVGLLSSGEVLRTWREAVASDDPDRMVEALGRITLSRDRRTAERILHEALDLPDAPALHWDGRLSVMEYAVVAVSQLPRTFPAVDPGLVARVVALTGDPLLADRAVTTVRELRAWSDLEPSLFPPSALDGP